MKRLQTLQEFLDAVQDKTGLTLLLEGWDEGFQLHEGLSGAQVVEMVARATQKYGNDVGIRAFNEEVDVRWDGAEGILVEGPPAHRKTLLLETDYRRFPGVRVFRSPDDREVRYTHAEVEEVQEGTQTVYLRLLRLLEGG